MSIDKINDLPESVQKALNPYVAGLAEVYGTELISAFVYGNATDSDYNPKMSDINLAIVLEDVSIPNLKKSLKYVKKGIRQKVLAPLFLTQDYMKMSLDTFPMEFMDMQETSVILCGEDVFKDLNFNMEDLRRECEYQLKGKLLTIRQAFLEQSLNRKGLEKLIKNAFRALMPVFRSTLKIKGVETKNKTKEDILNSVAKEYNINVSSFLEILNDKKADGKISGKPAEEFIGDFLTELEKLSIEVDNL